MDFEQELKQLLTDICVAVIDPPTADLLKVAALCERDQGSTMLLMDGMARQLYSSSSTDEASQRLMQQTRIVLGCMMLICLQSGNRGIQIDAQSLLDDYPDLANCMQDFRATQFMVVLEATLSEPGATLTKLSTVCDDDPHGALAALAALAELMTDLAAGAEIRTVADPTAKKIRHHLGYLSLASLQSQRVPQDKQIDLLSKYPVIQACGECVMEAEESQRLRFQVASKPLAMEEFIAALGKLVIPAPHGAVSFNLRKIAELCAGSPETAQDVLRYFADKLNAELRGRRPEDVQDYAEYGVISLRTFVGVICMGYCRARGAEPPELYVLLRKYPVIRQCEAYVRNDRVPQDGT